MAFSPLQSVRERLALNAATAGIQQGCFWYTSWVTVWNGCCHAMGVCA